jgi:hypothetical protein
MWAVAWPVRARRPRRRVLELVMVVMTVCVGLGWLLFGLEGKEGLVAEGHDGC